MLVGAGYRVVLPNIRGSAGYGADWIRPQLGDWGGIDVADVVASAMKDCGLFKRAKKRGGFASVQNTRTSSFKLFNETLSECGNS